jgi:predicted dehydrogenase
MAMKRREFLKHLTRTTATLSATALSSRRIASASERVRVALIGCGGRGTHVAKLMAQMPGVQFVAACDVYDSNTEKACQWMGSEARPYKDFRKVLEQKDVDAVLIGTPDHWHAIPTVLACQAGKDVYVEKPLAHNIKEGRTMVDTARKYGRIVQTGMQHRSAPHYQEVQRIVQSEELGEVRYVRVWNYVNMFPFGIGHVPDADPPPGLDWDFYLGPAPKVPFNKNRFLRYYRWFWDYAGGWITDFGTHRLDTVQQVMGVEAPLSVNATGGRFSLKDDGEMPDVLQVTYEYPGFVLSYETLNVNGHGLGGRSPDMKYYMMRGKEDRPHGEAFYGTNGTLFCDRISFEIYPEPEPHASQDLYQARSSAPQGFRIQRRQVQAKDTTDLHVKNFIDCVRSREKPAADVEIGHRSTTVAHLGNIGYKIKRKLFWDAAKEDFKDALDASKLLGRAARRPWDLI